MTGHCCSPDAQRVATVARTRAVAQALTVEEVALSAELAEYQAGLAVEPKGRAARVSELRELFALLSELVVSDSAARGASQSRRDFAP
jgi:hypothetical protein